MKSVQISVQAIVCIAWTRQYGDTDYISKVTDILSDADEYGDAIYWLVYAQTLLEIEIQGKKYLLFKKIQLITITFIIY